MKKIMVMAMAVSAFAAAQAIDVDFLRELVAIPSVSADIPQVNRAVRTMKAYLEKRGVYDCKGRAVAVAETLCALAGKDLSVGCIFGSDEELGGLTTTWMAVEKGYAPKKMAIVTIDFLTQEAKRP